MKLQEISFLKKESYNCSSFLCNVSSDFISLSFIGQNYY